MAISKSIRISKPILQKQWKVGQNDSTNNLNNDSVNWIQNINFRTDIQDINLISNLGSNHSVWILYWINRFIEKNQSVWFKMIQ